MESKGNDLLPQKETTDPDYVAVSTEQSQKQVTLSLQQQDAKEHTVNQIEKIIQEQFGLEVHLKQKEVESIDHRISQTKAMLDRLRACILARYYGTSERLLAGDLPRTRRSRRHKEGFLGKISTGDSSSSGLNGGSRVSNVSSEALQIGRQEIPAVKGSKAEVLVTCSTSSKINLESKVVSSDNSPNIQQDAIDTGSSSLINKHSNSVQANSNQSQGSIQVTTSQSQGSIQVTSSQSQGSIQVTTSQSLGSIQVKANHQSQVSLQVATGQSESNMITGKLNIKSEATTSSQVSGSRFYIKKRIIIGNTSKYIPMERREENDKSTHKWMVYVRGLPEDLPIHHYIKKVWFFLHPSYRPNDIVEINKPPFQLTRRGWGEFPIRVQLHFADPRNKRVDIIHELKLDKTYTGLQTMGSETVIDLEIERKTFEDLGLPVPELQQSVIQCPEPGELIKTDASSQKVVNAITNKDIGLTEVNTPSQVLQGVKQEPTAHTSSAASYVAATPSSSCPVSRCTSPEIQTKVIDSELEKLLHKVAPRHPLIHPERNVAKYPYCAASVDQFMSWNLYKRRAAEWQRALHIKRFLQISKSCKSCDLSTKDIMIWCRRYGYTPTVNLPKEAMHPYCKICGTPLTDADLSDTEEDENERNHRKCKGLLKKPPNSYTTSNELLSELETREKMYSAVLKCKDNQDTVVDVVNIPSHPPRPGSIPHHKPQNLTMPLTTEQQWIKDTCNEIGVPLRPVVVKGVEVHAVESALYSVATRFIADLMRNALALSTNHDSTVTPRVMVPGMVYKALGAVPGWDFLTNSHIGHLVTGENTNVMNS